MFDALVPGLAIRVTPAGHKSFTLYYRHHGRMRRVGLGRVTVAGQSAGAQDLHHLTASPLATGLFHRTIAQSGSGLSQLNDGYALRAHEAACERFVAAKGAGSLSVLRAMTWQQLIAPLKASPTSSGTRPSCPASPVIDGYVLPQGVGPTYAQGRQNDVPMLTGWNADDGLTGTPITPDELRTRLSQRYRENAPRLLTPYPSFATRSRPRPSTA